MKHFLIISFLYVAVQTFDVIATENESFSESSEDDAPQGEDYNSLPSSNHRNKSHDFPTPPDSLEIKSRSQKHANNASVTSIRAKRQRGYSFDSVEEKSFSLAAHPAKTRKNAPSNNGDDNKKAPEMKLPSYEEEMPDHFKCKTPSNDDSNELASNDNEENKSNLVVAPTPNPTYVINLTKDAKRRKK